MPNPSNKLVIALVVVVAIGLVLLVLLSKDVHVTTANMIYGSSNDRYILNTHEVDNVLRFSIIDTKDGYTYVFKKEEAAHTMAPLTPAE